jgi:hypothetical protein
MVQSDETVTNKRAHATTRRFALLALPEDRGKLSQGEAHCESPLNKLNSHDRGWVIPAIAGVSTERRRE